MHSPKLKDRLNAGARKADHKTLHTFSCRHEIAGSSFSLMTNFVCLPALAVHRITSAATSLRFDRIYGAWWDAVVPSGAKEALQLSARRCIDAIIDYPPRTMQVGELAAV
jgi:hypothetical protein